MPAASQLSVAEQRRYARQLALPGFGEAAQRRLRQARILVVGAGGLGSPCLLYLAAAGVGTLGVIDADLVETSNLQRQVIHTEAGVGAGKVAAAARAIGALNSGVRVRRHEVRMHEGNALDVVREYDLVCDGSDNFATRYLVNDACAVLGKPYVFGSVFEYEAQCGVFWAGRGPQYRDLYPAPPPPQLAPGSGSGGALGALCGIAGSVMAMEATKLVAGIGKPLLGRILVIDAWTMSIRELPVGVRTTVPEELGDYGESGATASGPAVSTISVTELRALLNASSPNLRPALVDVREPGELAGGTINGAVNVPLARVLTGAGLAAIPPGRPVVFYCATGTRSARAALAARQQGRGAVTVLDGGIAGWLAAGLSVVRPD